MRRHRDRADLSSRSAPAHLDLGDPAAPNAVERGRGTARVQPARGGGDSAGVLWNPPNGDRFRNMIIAQVTDTHIAHDAPDADGRVADLERTIADINALDP